MRTRRPLWALASVVGAAVVLGVVSARPASARVPAARVVTIDSGGAANGSRSTLLRGAAAFLDSLRGRSGKLRARFLTPTRVASIPVLRSLFGERDVPRTGMSAPSADDGSAVRVFVMRPFADKVRGRIGSYHIGTFPSEMRTARSSAYENPEGFIEVTEDNRNAAISEHFRLNDFLTHNQAPVWPKYLVLREPLIDKLELVIAELKTMGVAVGKLHVMSGFRTPQYNEQGVGAGGRVKDSRHQFGDAADVYVVNGTRDWMGDLNGDGRVDTRDAQILADAADRVERSHPDLVGGVGIYRATSAHGPFVHIDVRGTRARWSTL